MSEINFEDTIINITLGDIIQQFTEEDLQRQMPILMQDIDAETKELVDTYQSYINSGNFAESTTYRANNPALETRIFDAFKANSLLVYCAFAYLYAKDKKQQCIVSTSQPPASSDDGSTIGQVEGDIWFKINQEDDSAFNVIPFVKQSDGTYKELVLYPKNELMYGASSKTTTINGDVITEIGNDYTKTTTIDGDVITETIVTSGETITHVITIDGDVITETTSSSSNT